MWRIPTTVLSTSQILELMLLLWSAQVPVQAVVYPLMDLSGTFLMEVLFNVLVLPTTEGGLFLRDLVEQYVSTVTLGLPWQESSTVTFQKVEAYRASMWGYILPPQVSPVQHEFFISSQIELAIEVVWDNVCNHWPLEHSLFKQDCWIHEFKIRVGIQTYNILFS